MPDSNDFYSKQSLRSDMKQISRDDVQRGKEKTNK